MLLCVRPASDGCPFRRRALICALLECSTAARNSNLLHGQTALLDPPELAYRHCQCCTTTCCLAFPCKNFCVRWSTLHRRHCCCLVSSAFEQTRSGNQLTTTSQLLIAVVCCSSWQRAMSDRGVQSCGSCLHLSTLFVGSDSTISCSANTWFSMKLKSMITTSLFHLFLVWHVEPKARRKQVGQHGFHQGACHAVSLFRVWAFGCLNEEETWQLGFVGPRHLATPSGTRAEAFGNMAHSGRFVQVRLVRSDDSGPFPTSGTFSSHVRVAS